jgi:predicted nucleic acid-binding protein
MNRVFADSGYWIALLRSRDALHQKAQHLAQQFRDYKIVTSELVLVEYLNDMSKLGGGYRRMAVDAVKRLRNDRNMEIVPTTSQQFWEAVQYYGSRRDQRWSLVDCSSFLIMEELKIRDALAHDRDFRQAGFTALLRDD